MASRKSGKPARKDVILLKDLAPRQDVRGGTGKLRFGEPGPKAPSTKKRPR